MSLLLVNLCLEHFHLMNDYPPPTPKQGLSTIAKVGIGCGGLFILVMLLGGLLAAKGCSKIKEFAGDYQKAPVTASAKLMVAMMPDMELVKADETTKEITLKDKKTGQTVTMTLDQLKQGKFSMSDSKGNETVIDSTTKGGQIKVKNAEGTTVFGGDTASVPLPSWIPVYAGATATPGGMRSEKEDKVHGIAVSESTDEIAKIKAFYESKLKEAGFKLENTTDTADSAAISATKDDSKQTLQISINRAGNKTSITTIYEGPK
ncbi:MAG: hypothetical protein JWO94_3498 [Verrucomicrobiaceae bacterium]|nr:hypothetical protein [Verrucomicrobiaceae bacterium]